MSIVLQGSTSGSITLQEPAVAGSTVLSLPATSGTLITTGSSGQSIPKAALPTGSVLQVVSTTKTDTFSMSSSGTPTAVTGLSVSITPTSSTSKILVFGQVTGSLSNVTYGWHIVLYKNGSVITGATGDSGNSQPRATSGMFHNYNYGSETIPFTYFDSPATTSSTTYQIYTFQEPGATFYINRPGNATFSDGRSANHISTITVMEIAA